MSRVMKDSGIKWLGMIPQEWDIIPQKYLMYKKKVICDRYQKQNILSLTRQGVIVRDLENPSGKMPTTFDGYQILEPNNLLMCLFDIDVTPRCIGLIKNKGLTSPAYSQFVLKDGSVPEFYNYYFHMIDNDKIYLHLSRNLRNSLTETDFGYIKALSPPVKEQIDIVNYLDVHVNNIDENINKIKLSINEYRKYKQNMITESVTKGLVSNVNMKDSGIEWIGEIPVHWYVSKPFRVCEVVRGNCNFQKTDLKESGDYVALQYGKTYKVDEVNDDFNFYVDDTFYKDNQLVSNGNTILVSTSETIEDLGHSCFYSRNDVGLLGGEQMCLRPDNQILENKFFYYASKYFGYELRKFATGLKVYRFKVDDLKRIGIVIPPINEQLIIVSYLDKQIPILDKLINDKEKIILELEAYKKSLIYEVVTGKKEVV